MSGAFTLTVTSTTSTPTNSTGGLCLNDGIAFCCDFSTWALISADRKSVEIDWVRVREIARRVQTMDQWQPLCDGEAGALLLWLATNEGVKP